MHYFCCTAKRRNAVRLHPTLNGIDYLEVVDNPDDPIEERQRMLILHFLKPESLATLTTDNIIIKGGERIRDIQIEQIALTSPPSERLTITVNTAGDFSEYTLCLVRSEQDESPPAGFDLLLSRVDFSFKVACPTDFDCKTERSCIEEKDAPPAINYLAKDYASFRQLMLDRMSLLMPNWTERNPADLGITLVELLAYTADYLSYRQDAISSEAYLGTARKRISVRRHARLVDYHLHDGCNARTWVHLKVAAGTSGIQLPSGKDIRFLTKVSNLSLAFRADIPLFEQALQAGATVFEPLHDLQLYAEHNEFHFYTYGEEECCLPKGATEATLIGDWRNLKAGDVLIFVEVRSPQTGHPQDADINHRHVVRLTEVSYGSDINVDYYSQFSTDSPPSSPPAEAQILFTKIKWYQADALPFPLCISGKGEAYYENVSVAYGNVVLVDHGMTISDTNESSLFPATVPAAVGSSVTTQRTHCEDTSLQPIPPRYNPTVQQRPLTFALPLPDNFRELSASTLLKNEVRQALPAIFLTEDNASNKQWKPQRDLLIDSAGHDPHFVVEITEDDQPYLRFGDDKNGMRPQAGTTFKATYRIGNGVAGNIGANTIAHLVTNDAAVLATLSVNDAYLTNPLAAKGGQKKEPIKSAKLYAPHAFRTQKRAVTTADYESRAKECDPTIQQTTASFRWTGSWKTAFISADRQGGLAVDDRFDRELRNCLEQYRMAGIDLQVDAPIYVPLELEIKICVAPNYFNSEVKRELLQLFSSNLLPNGQRGLFHPDNFSFGQAVYLSRLYAAAQRVTGVRSVEVTKFQRWGKDHTSGITDGYLTFNRKEIPQLENNPNFRERGVVSFIMQGGR